MSACAAPASGHMSCYAQKLEKHVVARTAATAAAAAAARAARPALATGPAGGYTPNEIATAYGVNANAATTQTVAIVDAHDDPSVLADLNAFDQQYGLHPETSASFKKYFDTPTHTAPSPDPGWSTEITLDVQAVRGLCHKCTILLVEAPSDDGAALAHAVTYAAKHARIISNSYGTPDTNPGITAGIAAIYNKPGVAMLAASGDDGWYGWDFWNCTSADCGGANQETDSAPSFPASLNTVVGVGGTALQLTSAGTRASESVWNDNGPGDVYGINYGFPFGAAGSGCSTRTTPQRWQSHVARYSSLGCGSKRSSVDIAADADPLTGLDVLQTYGNDDPACTGPATCWGTVGGTSLAAPLVGAMWALAGGPGSVQYPALSLYGHFQSTAGSTYDVTSGGSGLCDTVTPAACISGALNPNAPGRTLDCAWGVDGVSDHVIVNRYQCYAERGFDGVSGVGTPKGLTVFKRMTPHAIIRSPGTVTHGVTHTFSASGSSDPFPGGGFRTYAWNWGDGHSTSTSHLTASHKYASRGTRTITLTVTDFYGVRASRTITVAVR
jgi:hypothetical protein